MRKIKILLVHNRYKQSGGEDQVFLNESELLKFNGEEVITYTVHNDAIKQSLKSKIEVGINSIWSYKEYKKFKRFLRYNKPDIVHVHNFFPLISPSIFSACNKLNIPVVQTLHNYRLICPAATFLRDNEICEKCLTGSLVNSVKYGCYRDSVFQTIPVATMIGANRAINTWQMKVDKYIALTNFSKQKFIEGGLPSEKISVKPNFMMESPLLEKTIERENYYLFVGRVSKEKGIHLLLEAFVEIENKTDAKLLIIGDGPEKRKLEEKYKNNTNIVFKGKLNKDEILIYMKKAKYLVVPSIWYEGFPMTIIEAYSVNTPVIASAIGSLKEVVTDNETGFHFIKGNKESLKTTLLKAASYIKYDFLVHEVGKQYKDKYTSNINYKTLLEIYKEVIESKKYFL